LDVLGNIRASGSFIAGGTALNVPDYVFDPDYQLMPLKQLAAYVEKEKHLPDIPSARTIREEGINIAEMQMQLLRKVEELTLYILEQQQVIEGLKEETQQLRERLSVVETGPAGRRLRSRSEARASVGTERHR
jgi:hypothetical protein